MLRDERGLVFVLALPLALVLVFALWHVARVGDAILERERVQDAADAAAFESALLHARGMNALALLASLEEVQPALVRELAPKLAAVVPVLATVAAVEDNTPFYERTLMTASHALLSSDDFVRDLRRPWAFGRGASGPRLGGPSSLPVQRVGERLRVWSEAENGNAMLQVWAWAQPREGQPAVAQAEYYFACGSEWSACEPLRSLAWTARMRRVWLPSRANTSIEDASARADDQLRTLLPNAPKVAALFRLFETSSWMH